VDIKLKDVHAYEDPNSLGDPLISVVIPAFNEERSLGFILQRTYKVLGKMGFPHEVIVVNDGSNDRTAKVAMENGMILINNDRNLGKGDSLKRGFERARGYFVVTLDADGEHEPEDIPSLLHPVLNGENGKGVSKDVAAVIGSRFNGVMEDKAMSRLHIIGNKLFNALILLLTGGFVSDSQSGFRVYRRDVLKDLALNSSGYEIETEIVVKMLRRGFVVKEVPITHRRRFEGCSRLNTLRDGVKILLTIVKARFCDRA
jgi:glycosyltransferase involved in cell wall biosynthesis